MALLAASCSVTNSRRGSRPVSAEPTVAVATTEPVLAVVGPAEIVSATVAEALPGDPPWYPSERIGLPYGDAVQGVLTFRGSPNRTFHGRGPVPTAPSVLWRYPDRSMCSLSVDQDGEREWCGTGWTGQPAVWERQGELWVAFGAYDRQVHVLDALTGAQRMSSFTTGDLIKGSLTVDPDGHPLLYVGSRDNSLRVLAYDTGELRELWRLDAADIEPRVWNDDWDGSPVVLDDYLFVGGENSNFHVVRLHRGYDQDGHVTVAPELQHVIPGWDQELRSAVGDNVSIESSVTIVDDIAYFANSGGLVQGWDLAPVRDDQPPEQTLRYWVGDDTDATIVVDDEGFLYAASEYERGNARSRDLGQVIKLDPRRPDDPLVWAVAARSGIGTGVWASPAIYAGVVIVPTADGRVLGLDRDTGDERWTLRLPGPLWSSPVVIDDVLIQADCGGFVHAFDLGDGSDTPIKRWSVAVGGCIESTPVVWDGRIWVGTRDGFFYMLGDDEG